jgi:hypothetical protein
MDSETELKETKQTGYFTSLLHGRIAAYRVKASVKIEMPEAREVTVTR